MLSLLLAAALLAEETPPRVLPIRPEVTAQDLVYEMEAIAKAQEGLHPLAARDLDARLAPYLGRLRRLDRKAVPLLSWYIRQEDRPLKLRVHAAAALGLIGDPAALPALKDAAHDAKAYDGLRSACVQAIASLRLADHEKRALLDRFLRGAPPVVLREALRQLAPLGTDDVKRTLAAAKSFGTKPEGAAETAAGAAADALGRSPDSKADEALVSLVRFYRPGAAPRARALAALARRRAEGRRYSPSRSDLDLLLEVPFQEKGEAALTATRHLGLLGDRRAVPRLIRLLKGSDDAAVVAEAARALAALGDPAAKEPLAALVAGLSKDARFGGRDDAGPLAASVEEAARSFPGPAVSTPAARGFAYEGWPGSGVPHPVLSGGRPLVLRREPRGDSPEAGRASEPLRLAGSVLSSRRPGWARSRAKTALEARSFGARERLSRAAVEGPAPRATLPLALGGLIEVLAPLSGGECFVRLEGAVYAAACPHLDRERFEVVEEPVSEWWLELEHPGGRGWAHADDAALTILRD